MCSPIIRLQSRGLNGSQWQASRAGPLGLQSAGDRWRGSSLKCYSPHYYFHAVTFCSRSQCFPGQGSDRFSGARFELLLFSYEQRFVKILLVFFCFLFCFFPVLSQSKPHALSVCATHAQNKKPCPVVCWGKKRFISVTKEIKQSERFNACRFHAAPRFKKLCLLSVRPFTFQV